jgi:hypothetical protein
MLLAVAVSLPGMPCAVLAKGVEGGRRVRPGHPRLGLLPDGTAGKRTVAAVRRLFESDENLRTYFGPALERAEKALDQSGTREALDGHPNVFAACWVVTGDDRFAEAAIGRLLGGEITLTYQSGYYSNAWRFALAYDWLYHHPFMTDLRRDTIEERIGSVVREELVELDGGYPAMWHGRNQLANNTLVAALALSRHPDAAALQRRAVRHFADAVRALSITQGWPEGPSYWIYNRAFPYALAADCFMTATGRDAVEGLNIGEAIRQVAYWHLYAMRPDGTMARYGDCWPVGPSRNRGLWQPVQDYYARLTGDPALIAAAEHFRRLSDTDYHGWVYAWATVLTYDPRMAVPPDYDRDRPEAYLNEHLPRARLFGRHSLGQAFLVERWGDPDATWISFKAGDVLAHHGHYDQGSFTIYRGSPLVVHSGHYADYFSDFRLGYYIQTISANSILVEAPDEFSTFARERGYFHEIAGGQRVVIPTGCDVTSVNDWLRNRHRGMHYEAGDILTFDSSASGFDYVAADITAAYNSTRYSESGNPAKVSSVVRKLAYLTEPNALVVFDRVVTTDPSFATRWVLHTPAKPATATETLTIGERADDGILTTRDRWSRTSHERGQLFHQVLLPSSPHILKIGGNGYRHYVRIGDGGRNLAPTRPRTDLPPSYGLWRTEVIDTDHGREHLFLNVLWPRIAGEDAPQPARLMPGEPPATVVAVADWLVVFALSGTLEASFAYEAPAESRRHVIVDLPPRSTWRVDGPGEAQQLIASEDGVLSFGGAAGRYQLSEVPPRDGPGHM